MNHKSAFPLFFSAIFCLAEMASADWAQFFASNVRTRAQWGAKAAKPGMTKDQTKRMFVVHHSAGPATFTDATVRSIQTDHVDTRGWSDLGYHFLIGSGKIFEGRSLDYAGAHVLGHNNGTIGLNFLGCYDSKECHPPKYPEVSQVSDQMITAMGKLIGALSLRYNMSVSATTVKGHKEFSGAATACPGDRVMARMAEIIAIAAGFSFNVHDEL